MWRTFKMAAIAVWNDEEMVSSTLPSRLTNITITGRDEAQPKSIHRRFVSFALIVISLLSSNLA